jgi:hypothetical protein
LFHTCNNVPEQIDSSTFTIVDVMMDSSTLYYLQTLSRPLSGPVTA